MDICSFINSKTICDYLREIKYEFSALEAAWLIFHCRSITLRDKHEAWKQLVQEMPDCKVKKRPNCMGRESLFELINEYISIVEKQYELFERHEVDAVYQYRVYCAGSSEWDENYQDVYATINECWKEIDKYREYSIEAVQIRKRYVGINKTIDVSFNPDKTVTDIDSNVLTDSEFDVITKSFDGLWFDFPVPFKKGDILVNKTIIGPRTRSSESGPIVVLGVTPGDIEHNKDKKRFGDNSDMNVWGYFQEEDGRIFYEVTHNYMDFDYYEGPFVGPQCLLVALGNYIKDKISLELLLSAYRKTIMDEISYDHMLHSWYTGEGLKLAGLSDLR